MLVNISNAAKILGGIGESTLRRWVSEGKIPVVRLGRRVMIRPEDLAALIDAPQRPAQEKRTHDTA